MKVIHPAGDDIILQMQAMACRLGEKDKKDLLLRLQSIDVNVDSSNWRTAVRGRFTTNIAPFI